MNTTPRTLTALVIGLLLGVGVCLFILGFLDPSSTVSNTKQSRPANTAPLAAPPKPPTVRLFPSAPETPREFRESQDKDSVAWTQIEQEFWAATDESVQIEILDRIESDLYTARLLPFLEKLFATPTLNSAVRERALELLSGNLSPDILPILQNVMRQSDADLRARSLLAASQVRSPDTAAFLGSAFTDPSPLVRLTAFDTLEHQTEQTRRQVLEKALTAPHPDAALHALGELQVDSNHASVPLLIQGLNAPLPEVRDEATSALEFLFDQRFENAAQATDWWATNQKRYDQNLVEKN